MANAIAVTRRLTMPISTAAAVPISSVRTAAGSIGSCSRSSRMAKT